MKVASPRGAKSMQKNNSVKRAAIYVRVSTTNRARGSEAFEQNPEVQELPLRQLIAQRGWSLTHVYSDRMSGAKENRSGLKRLMEDARRGQFDVVLVWRFDRFARSIEQLVIALTARSSCPGGETHPSPRRSTSPTTVLLADVIPFR